MTALETKFTTLPSLSKPITSMIAPTRKVMVNRADGLLLTLMPACWITLPVQMAMALVSVLTIKIVPVLREAAMGATMLEYSPYTGLTPISLA